jgi:hypothetical protein
VQTPRLQITPNYTVTKNLPVLPNPHVPYKPLQDFAGKHHTALLLLLSSAKNWLRMLFMYVEALTVSS